MRVKCWFCDGKGGSFEKYVSRSHNDMDWNKCEYCGGTGKIDIPNEFILEMKVKKNNKMLEVIDYISMILCSVAIILCIYNQTYTVGLFAFACLIWILSAHSRL